MRRHPDVDHGEVVARGHLVAGGHAPELLEPVEEELDPVDLSALVPNLMA
jgi:hypothetical protein